MDDRAPDDSGGEEPTVKLESFSDVENKVDEKKYMHQSAGVPAESKQRLHVPKRKAKAGNITW